MANNSCLDVPVVTIGLTAYDGNPFIKPWTRAMTPAGGVDRSRLEGGIDTLYAGDAVRASGSPTADYTASSYFLTTNALGVMYIDRPADWLTDFFPPIT